jgi:hypothetical protein
MLAVRSGEVVVVASVLVRLGWRRKRSIGYWRSIVRLNFVRLVDGGYLLFCRQLATVL